MSIGLIMIGCSGNQESDESTSSQELNKPSQEQPETEIKEKYSFEVENFIVDDSTNKTMNKLPYEFNYFKINNVGAYYDEKYKTLSIYFSNFENPEVKYGTCCANTNNADHRTISYVIKWSRETDELDYENSYVNYSTKDEFQSMNMTDKTMSGDFEMHEDHVEGELHYKNDVDSSAYMKTEFVEANYLL